MFGKGTLLFTLLPALMAVPMGSEAKIPVEKATLAGGCFWCMCIPLKTLTVYWK